jgi:ubiquitin-conjugating enzyme E2 O
MGHFFWWQQVHYHSGGLELNPNLYGDGYVCLSLLGTWEGDEDEMWTPGVSTMLQVLVSIQGLILNAKPYFNEPGYEKLSGKPDGEKKALQYNEDTFILSLRTMTYMIRNPPKVWFYSWFVSLVFIFSNIKRFFLSWGSSKLI